MKVKRFNNLWTMGLILTGAILVLFYIAKIFFPEFIVGVAEIPRIVEFGIYVDSHKWAFYIFHFFVSYFGGYLYYCACTRKHFLSLKQNVVFICSQALGIFFQEVSPTVYTPYSYSAFILLPLVLCYMDKTASKETFLSTSICFSIDIMAQALSMVIRNLLIITTCINSASMTILLIDAIIWRALLYFYYNFETKK